MNAKQFKEILETKIVSESPFSDSYYIINEGEEVTWGSKPEGSLRIADHWNWDNGAHCPIKNETDTINKLALAVQVNGFYEFIECDEIEKIIELIKEKLLKQEVEKRKKEISSYLIEIKEKRKELKEIDKRKRAKVDALERSIYLKKAFIKQNIRFIKKEAK